jgi:uncharacterized protein YkwD
MKIVLMLTLLTFGAGLSGCRWNGNTGSIGGGGGGGSGGGGLVRQTLPPRAIPPASSLPQLPELPVPVPSTGPAAPTSGGGSVFSTGGEAGGGDVALTGGDATGGPASPGSSNLPSGASTAGERTDFERQVDEAMLELINAERARSGAQPLRFDARLVDAAWKHTADMFNRHYIGHDDPDGLWPWDRARNAGFPVSGNPSDSVNENVADLFPRNDPRELARTALDMYRQSDGHWRNLLNPAWNVVGLGTMYRPDQASTDSNGVQVTPNTQLFGRM